MDQRELSMTAVQANTRTNGLGENISDRPASLEAAINCRPWYSQPVGPIRNGQCLTVQREISGTSGISGLRGPYSPATVAGAIDVVVVDSVQSVFAERAFAHVCKKVGESLPAVAYDDATASIVRELSRRGLTSIVHSGPCTIGTSALVTPIVSVVNACGATTTSGNATNQIGASNESRRPAFTSAAPDNVAPHSLGCRLYDSKSSNLPSSQVE